MTQNGIDQDSDQLDVDILEHIIPVFCGRARVVGGGSQLEYTKHKLNT